MYEFKKNLQPTPGDVHVNRPLTNISVAFMQDAAGFVADRVFPNIPVAKQSDLYYIMDRTFWNRSEMEKRAPGTESKGIGWEVSTDPYFAHVYALHHDIEDERRANADSVFSLDEEATDLLSSQAMLKRETLFASTYFQTGIWTTELQGVPGVPAGGQFRQWDDDASTPIEDIRAARTTAKLVTGMRPNTMVMGVQVWDALMDHPDIMDRLKYGQTPGSPADVDLSDLVALFKIPRIFVMDAIENAAAEGAAEANAFIGGKHALLVWVPPRPGLRVASAGYTFSWNGFLAAGNMGQRIRKFRREALNSDRIEIEMAFDQKLISADLGFFFNDAVA